MILLVYRIQRVSKNMFRLFSEIFSKYITKSYNVCYIVKLGTCKEKVKRIVTSLNRLHMFFKFELNISNCCKSCMISAKKEITLRENLTGGCFQPVKFVRFLN